MSSIIADLQKEVFIKDVSITDLLLKALFVARKLKLNEFEKWINNELDGYKDINTLWTLDKHIP